MAERRGRVVGTLSFLALMVGGAAAACSSDVDEDSGGGGAGEAGEMTGSHTGATGGNTPATGGSAGGEVLPEAGAGGARAGGAGAAGSAGSGDQGNGSSGASGEGGAAGTGPTEVDETAVHGRVIDLFGYGVPGVIAEIGGNLATTDEDGRFTLEHVAPEYDVTLLVQYAFTPGSAVKPTHGWAFQGVTRRAPTLQVQSGGHGASFKVHPIGFDFGSLIIHWGVPVFGGSDYFVAPGPPPPTSFSIDATWSSPATLNATLFAVGRPATGSGLLFGSTKVALAPSLANVPVDLQMNLAVTTPVTLAGVVTTAPPIPSQAGHVLATSGFVYLQMPDGGAVQLDESGLNGEFTLPSTLVSGTTLSLVTVTADNDRSPPLALVHEDGIVASTSGLQITMPQPATLAAPKYPITIDPYAQEFSYTLGMGQGPAVVVAFNDHGSNTFDGAALDWLFVVTTKQHFKLPKIVDGRLALRRGTLYGWNVQTHGTPANVDAMVGAAGFVDPYSSHGPTLPYVPGPLPTHSGRGSLTISDDEAFSSAP